MTKNEILTNSKEKEISMHKGKLISVSDNTLRKEKEKESMHN
jgi:hypothetical protein